MHIHRTESGFTSDVLTSLGAVNYNRALGKESAVGLTTLKEVASCRKAGRGSGVVRRVSQSASV